MDPTAVLRHLHEARLAHYRSNCAPNASDEDVLALYLWNAELASALSEVLGFAEVAIRHSIDTQLGIWANTEVGTDEWVNELANLPLLKATFAPTRRQLYKAADESRKARSSTHPRSGHSINHDDMVAHIMFGTWARLLPEKFNPHRVQPDGTPVQDLQNLADRRELWRTVLHDAFPNVAKDPRGIGTGNKVRELRKLRNRVSHMDSLLYINVRKLHDEVLLPLLNSIDHDLRDWVRDRSPVSDVLLRRPTMTSGSVALI